MPSDDVILCLAILGWTLCVILCILTRQMRKNTIEQLRLWANTDEELRIIQAELTDDS